MRGMSICDKVCLGVVSTSSLPSWDKGQFFLADQTPREGRGGDLSDGVPSGGSVFRQIRGVERKPLPEFAVFQVPTSRNSQCAKVAYLGVACPELLQSYFGVAYSATLQKKRKQMC